MKKHVIIGSAICLATVLILGLFWGKLPMDVPIHFDSAGNVDSTLPKPIVVFGIPVICALINGVASFSLLHKQEKRKFMFYLIPVIAVVLAVAVIVLSVMLLVEQPKKPISMGNISGSEVNVTGKDDFDVNW